jgi:phosphoglycolate phosphatase-like HAD superfamily hydrolase
MTALRALILDFDGVLVESNAIKTLAFEAVFSRFPDHTAHMMAYHHAHVSDSRYAKFRYFVTERLGRPADDPLVEELAAALSLEVRDQITRCPEVRGAADFLRAVSSRVPVYLASVTPQAELDGILAGRAWTRFFARVYGCPPWTKVTALADIVSVAGGADGIVFIGDSAGDQRASEAAGVEFLGRDSGLPFDAPAPPCVADMREALTRLEPRLSKVPVQPS